MRLYKTQYEWSIDREPNCSWNAQWQNMIFELSVFAYELFI